MLNVYICGTNIYPIKDLLKKSDYDKISDSPFK